MKAVVIALALTWLAAHRKTPQRRHRGMAFKNCAKPASFELRISSVSSELIIKCDGPAQHCLTRKATYQEEKPEMEQNDQLIDEPCDVDWGDCRPARTITTTAGAAVRKQQRKKVKKSVKKKKRAAIAEKSRRRNRH